MIIIQLLALLAAFRAKSASQYYIINQGLSQLEDWLEENVESEEPRENLEAILKEFSNLPDTLLNRSKFTTVKFLQAIKEAVEDPTVECARPHLELIRLIQRSSHCYSTFNFLRTDTLLRPYALALIAKCDKIHEREFERIKSEHFKEFQTLKNIINEAFIERHLKKLGNPIHFRDDHFQLKRCCTPMLDELADLILLKSMKLNSDESSPELIAPLVERKFERNLGRPCSKYLELLNDTFEMANSASYFDSAKDFHFIAKRSHAYQSAVFRYKFCQDVLAKRSEYIEQLTRGLIKEQAPA